MSLKSGKSSLSLFLVAAAVAVGQRPVEHRPQGVAPFPMPPQRNLSAGEADGHALAIRFDRPVGPDLLALYLPLFQLSAVVR